MKKLKAWSDDDGESSSEVLDEDDVEEVVGEDGVLPGDGDDAQGLTQVGCALGLAQVEGVELLQGLGGVVVVGGEVVVGGGEVDDVGSGR
jgi:hypothetical protein